MINLNQIQNSLDDRYEVDPEEEDIDNPDYIKKIKKEVLKDE